MSGGWNDSLSKQRLPHHWLSPAWGLQVSWDAPHNFKDAFPLISTHRTLGINEKLFKKWQSYNVAWAHQEWHRFAFFHNISFTRVAHKHQTVTQENNHQVDTHIHDGLQEFTSTFQLFAELEIPLYSPCCFLPEERLQRRRSQRRFDYLMGKIRRCGAAGPCRCIDVQKKRQKLKVPGRGEKQLWWFCSELMNTGELSCFSKTRQQGLWVKYTQI